MTTTITLDIVPGQAGNPPTVHASAPFGADAAITANTDAALVARTMLQAAAYLFAQGQPVAFGPEIPREVLK